MTDRVFEKADPSAPAGFFEVEAAGLRWLGEATPSGGVAVADVLDVAAGRLTVARVPTSAPTPGAAEAFGAALAATHRSGAPAHGSPPAGWAGDGFIGHLPLPHRPRPGWPQMYAQDRVAPYLRLARDRGAIDAAGAVAVDRLVQRLADGRLGLPEEPPARLHGDLWSGNVLWAPTGVVLVDPAAHGGNRETDLAMLALFGLPHLDRVRAAYDAAWPLAAGWAGRVELHQLHPLLVHAALFGGGYGAAAVRAATRYS